MNEIAIIGIIAIFSLSTLAMFMRVILMLKLTPKKLEVEINNSKEMPLKN